MNGRPRTEVTFKTTLFATLLSPCVTQGCHNVHGGSQNHPPSGSPMIAAVPLSANAAVNRQIRAACISCPASSAGDVRLHPAKSQVFLNIPISTFPSSLSCSSEESSRADRPFTDSNHRHQIGSLQFSSNLAALVRLFVASLEQIASGAKICQKLSILFCMRHVLFILVAGLIPAVAFARTPSPEERLSRLESMPL
jgi:hypothetical protein